MISKNFARLEKIFQFITEKNVIYANLEITIIEIVPPYFIVSIKIKQLKKMQGKII